MANRHHEVNLNRGSRLLLYTGIGIAILAILLSVISRPLIPPKTLFVDDGRLLIANGSGSPRVILDKSGHPITEMDSITRIETSWFSFDKLYRIDRAKTVTVVDVDKTWETCTVGQTVRDLMSEQIDKFALQKLDRIEPSPDTLVKDKMKITIKRVTCKNETRTEKIQPDFELKEDPGLARGKMVTEKAGKPGVKETTYRKFYINGKLSQTQKVNEKVVTKSEPGVKRIGSRILTMSRSGYRGKRMLEMVATAYDAGPLSTGKSADGRTATGAKVRHGIVAVDPKVIPLGTKLFVEGYGEALAADTGGAIKGLRIDLFYESRKEALKFGRRKVKVYIIE